MRLEASNAGFRYAKRDWIFRGVNLRLDQGELVGLLGPSGCGKTTLGRMLAGYEEPLEGDVTIDESPLIRNGYRPVQMIGQHPEKAVNPRWKISAILNEGWEPDEDTLSILGVERAWLQRRTHQLSGGELQRVCIARALGPQTRFLIADEMTTMLDAITQAQVWHALLSIVRLRNLGVLVISHDYKLIERLCGRIYRRNGQTFEEG